MYLPASNSTLKILDQTLCPIFAIFKCFGRFTCKKNRPSSCSETSFTWNTVLNLLTAPTLNLAGYQFKKGKKSIFLTPNTTATPRTGIKHRFTAGILLLKMKILFRVTVLTGSAMNIHCFNGSSKERSKYAPQISKIWAFMANDLTGIDLVRCWVSWSILPLSRRPGLMCEYTGELKDPQCHIDVQLSDEAITEAIKKMLDEPISDCTKTGLCPYYASHKPPAVRIVFFCF